MKRRVLVVECNIQEQDWLTKSLNRVGGYHVIPCCDGDWAFAFLRTHLCHVVVVGRAMGTRLRTEDEFIEAVREIDPAQPLVSVERHCGTRRLLKRVARAKREFLPLFEVCR